MKIGTKGFSEMLITNLELDLSLLNYFIFFILWPVNSTRIEIGVIFSFYYINISLTGKLHIYKVMEVDNVYLILSSSFQ